jgi:hypothetical protein
MKTILGSVADLRRISESIGFDYHEQSHCQAVDAERYRELLDRIDMMWKLWVNEITARYFELKYPNMIKQIPHSNTVEGMTKERALEVITIVINESNELLENCSALSIYKVELKNIFSSFFEYLKNPIGFQNELISLAPHTESYLKDIQGNLVSG